MTNIDLGQVLPQPASASPMPPAAPAPVAVSPFIELLQAMGALTIDSASAVPGDGVMPGSAPAALPLLEATLGPSSSSPMADEETAAAVPPEETAAAMLLLVPAAPFLAPLADAKTSMPPGAPGEPPLQPGTEADGFPSLGAEAALLASPGGVSTIPAPEVAVVPPLATAPKGAGRALPVPGSPLPSAAAGAQAAYDRPLPFPLPDPLQQTASLTPDAALAAAGEAGAALGLTASGHGLAADGAADGAAALRELASSPGLQSRTGPPLPHAASMAPDLTLQMHRKDWDQPLGQQLLWMVEHQVQKAELRVNPPHLGPLEVRLSLEQDQARVNFFAHDASVREVIESALPRLREMLSGQGVQLGDATVSGHALARQQPGADGQPSRQGGGGFQGGSPGAAQPEWNEPPPVRGGVGLVDHYV